MVCHQDREVCCKCNEFHAGNENEDMNFKCNENEKLFCQCKIYQQK